MDGEVSSYCSTNSPPPSSQTKWTHRSRCITIEHRSAGETTGVPLLAVFVAEKVPEGSGMDDSMPFFLHEIRAHLLKETDNEGLPIEYCFVTAARAKIRPADEFMIRWFDVATRDDKIYICSTEDWNVHFFVNQASTPLGSLKLAFNVCLRNTRTLLHSDILPRWSLTLLNFIRPNGVPVNDKEEECLTVLSVSNHLRHVQISTQPFTPTKDTPALSATAEVSANDTPNSLPPFYLKPPPSSLAHRRRPGFLTPAVLDRQTSHSFKSQPRIESPLTHSVPPKTYLISYVSGEGKTVAIKLQKELLKHGCSVFLDVTEIQPGTDWQDLLNSAVQQCEVFVPLVTSSYGQTLWTNREIKMADLFRKMIIPVNMVSDWPPLCLAIQFTSMQFVKWATDQVGSQPGGSSESWEDERVAELAREIVTTQRNLTRQMALDEAVVSQAQAEHTETPPFAVSAKRRRSTIRSYPYDHRRIGRRDTVILQEAKKAKDGAPLVVVVAHPDQKDFVDRLRKSVRTTDVEMWSTTDDPRLFPDFYGQENSTPVPDDGFSSITRLSHISIGSGSSITTTSSLGEEAELFKEKINEAGIVLVVLSAAFALNKQCYKYISHAKHRKLIEYAVFDEFAMPGWLSIFVGSAPLLDCDLNNFAGNLLKKLKRSINGHAECPEEDLIEVSIQRELDFLKNGELSRDRSIYIADSGVDMPATRVNLSREIAAELAKLTRLYIVTGGTKGLGEEVGLNVAKIRKRSKQGDCLYYVLPKRSSASGSDDASPDGSKTFFVGRNARERQTIVGRYFKVCILIDGGSQAAHIAAEARWAENVVLPIYKTGGAAAVEDFESRGEIPPAGVTDAQWAVLRSTLSSDVEIAIAIREIVENLLPGAKAAPAKKLAKKRGTPQATPKTPGTALTTDSPFHYGLRDRKKLSKRQLPDDPYDYEYAASGSGGHGRPASREASEHAN